MFQKTLKEHSNKGFTLLDLLIATSIFLILVSIALPSFTHMAKNKRKENAVYSMMRVLNFARQEAVDYSADVLVCPSKDEKNCVADWNQPLMVFVDFNENGKLDEFEKLLRKEQLTSQRQSLSWKGAGSNRYISFDPMGTTGNQNGRIYYCDLSDKERYRGQLVVYRTGRIRIPSAAELREGCGES